MSGPVANDPIEQSEYTSFLVRLWRGAEDWQGDVYVVQTGVRIPCAGVEQIAVTIQEMIRRRDRTD